MARKLEVLAVEDNLGDATLLLEMLTEAGLLVNLTIVKDGRAALDILLEAEGHENGPTPGLVVLDRNLPRVQGFEVLRRMRESASLKDVPVVIMTGAPNEEDEKRARSLGVMAYLRKPCGLEEMDEVVGQLRRDLAPLLAQGKRRSTPRPAPTSQRIDQGEVEPDGEQHLGGPART